MSKVKVQHDEDFKKNAVRLSYANPKSVADVAADLGIKAEGYTLGKRNIPPKAARQDLQPLLPLSSKISTTHSK